MMAGHLNRQLARRPGQGLVEYGLILVLVMVVCVAILTMVGQTVSSVWYNKLIPAFQ
jgi:Flp pilus assembly pilin Flp